MTLNVNTCRDMLLHTADGIISNTAMLTEADKLGDADHGTGMENGFTAVKEKLAGKDFSDLGELFKSCGMAIMMSSGGASGVIFGSLFKDGAKALAGKQELDSASFAEFLQLGLESIMKRGKASPGDKTMIDALKPAADYAAEHKDDPLSDVVESCSREARAGSEATKEMKAAFGRMRTLGERTLGHPDPGSITMYLILEQMSTFIKGL